MVTNEFMTPAVEEEEDKGDKDEIKKKGFVRRMEALKGGLGEVRL